MPNEPAKAKTKVIKNVASLRGMSLPQIIMNNGWSKYIPNEASLTKHRGLLFSVIEYGLSSIIIIFSQNIIINILLNGARSKAIKLRSTQKNQSVSYGIPYKYSLR